MDENEDAENTAAMVDPNITKEMLENKLRKAISLKAYELYIKSGRKSGNDLLNWVEAEKEVLIDFRKEYVHLYL
ncbi:MAG: hypothetical protein A2231_07965 [Candidatus Firestonebacteria bacterium RIFOXYA2_FULL_40_8]|nr:MAG: hypothetical protein A2231_07965 [Candidatus Firestonebacteria bacterium RIFOXYA2_FULL_40_8]